MADFEHHAERAAQIALEIERKMIALGVDWRDDSAMRALAREALAFDGATKFQGMDGTSPDEIARMGLYGLIAVMLGTMTEGADAGEQVHGSDAWRALAKALWNEKGAS